MKNVLVVILITLIFAAGCQQDTGQESIDVNAVNSEVTAVADKYYSAWNAKDVETILSLTSDAGLFCGTDPSEVLDKTGLTKMITAVLKDSSVNFNYSIDMRKVQPAKDGNSAVVMEHISMQGFSSNMPMRQVFNFVKTNDKWIIDYIGWSFVVNNDDVQKLNEALD